MHLGPRAQAELRYLANAKRPLYSGSEQSGGPPMHTNDAELALWVGAGLIQHLPGQGYIITDAGRVEAFDKFNGK